MGYHLTTADDARPATKYLRVTRNTHGGPIFDWILSSKYTDAESGLIYYGYRYYVTEVGRWASRDPLEEMGGINTVAFVLNAPINASDATGLMGTPPAQPPAQCENKFEEVELNPMLNQTKTQMLGLPNNTKAGSAQHHREHLVKCCCTAQNEWKIRVTMKIEDQIFMADEKYAAYTPNKAQAKKHEDCHVEDHQKFFEAVYNQMVSAAGGTFQTESACDTARTSVESIYVNKNNDWKNRNEHPADRYGAGKPCHGSGYWR